jgi:hypothetical protein
MNSNNLSAVPTCCSNRISCWSRLNKLHGMSVRTARRTFSHRSDIILHSYSLVQSDIFNKISSSRTVSCILCKQHSHTIDLVIRNNGNIANTVDQVIRRDSNIAIL